MKKDNRQRLFEMMEKVNPDFQAPEDNSWAIFRIGRGGKCFITALSGGDNKFFSECHYQVKYSDPKVLKFTLEQAKDLIKRNITVGEKIGVVNNRGIQKLFNWKIKYEDKYPPNEILNEEKNKPSYSQKILSSLEQFKTELQNFAKNNPDILVINRMHNIERGEPLGKLSISGDDSDMMSKHSFKFIYNNYKGKNEWLCFIEHYYIPSVTDVTEIDGIEGSVLNIDDFEYLATLKTFHRAGIGFDFTDNNDNDTNNKVNKFWDKLYPGTLNEKSDTRKPKLILPIGISGSGKSTWIKANANSNTVIVCPDDIRRELTGDVSDQTKNNEVWSAAYNKIATTLNTGKDVILDATNVKSGDRKRLLSYLSDNVDKPFEVVAKIFDVDPEVAKQRVKKDIEAGVDRSNVPDWAIDKQYQKFVDGLKSLDDEGIKIID